MNSTKTLLREKMKNAIPSHVVYRLVAAWVVVCTILKAVNPYLFTDLDYFKGVSFPLAAASAAALWLFFCTVERTHIVVLTAVVSGFVYCALAIRQDSSLFFAFGCCVAFALLIAVSPLEKTSVRLSARGAGIVMVVLAAAFIVWVGGLCCLYYWNYDTPSFDFGVFTQMFYYMKKTGLPLTTVERHELMSHMAVHMSPVFYLLLPLYFLFPFPATLQIGQCLVVAAGLIPLSRICRRHQTGRKAAVLFAAILLTYVPFIGGCLFYIHENNFLVPMVLWMLDAFDCRKDWAMIVSTAMVLSVKEDAGVYAAAVCAYFLLKRYREDRASGTLWAEENTGEQEPDTARSRERAGDGIRSRTDKPLPAEKNTEKCRGKLLERALLLILEKPELWLLAICVLYFWFAVYILARFGNGAMTGRYDNFIYDGSYSLSVMLKGIFENPAFVLTQAFSRDKFLSIFMCFVPLGFLPLAGMEPEQIIFLAVYALMNLLAGYAPQHMIGYQYHFGSGSLLIYLAIVNYSRLRSRTAVKKLLLAAAACSMLLTLSRYGAKLLDYPVEYAGGKEDRERIEEALSKVPQDASVLCSTYLQPNLSLRDEIYDIGYTKHDESEYVVLDLRTRDGLPRIDDGNDWNEIYAQDEDFEQVDYAKGLVAVYRKKK